jgi:hypothetical protein
MKEDKRKKKKKEKEKEKEKRYDSLKVEFVLEFHYVLGIYNILQYNTI